MDARLPTQISFLSSLIETLMPHLPRSFRGAAVTALPGSQIQLERLGLEVLDAEERRVGYGESVRQPHFPIMAAVYFGGTDLLRWRLPRAARDALKPLLRLAQDGSLDAVRQL